MPRCYVMLAMCCWNGPMVHDGRRVVEGTTEREMSLSI